MLYRASFTGIFLLLRDFQVIYLSFFFCTLKKVDVFMHLKALTDYKLTCHFYQSFSCARHLFLLLLALAVCESYQWSWVILWLQGMLN